MISAVTPVAYACGLNGATGPGARQTIIGLPMGGGGVSAHFECGLRGDFRSNPLHPLQQNFASETLNADVRTLVACIDCKFRPI